MITIHCGLHKTGSTAIQLAITNVPRSQIPWVSVPVEGMDHSDAGLAERLGRIFKHPRIVLSDENILGSPFDGYRAAPQRVQLLYDILGRREATVIIYFRTHLAWLESLYFQAVQQGDSLSPDDFWTILRDSPWLEWNRLLDLLEDCPVNCNIVPRVYTPGNSILQDFFQASGLGAMPQLMPNDLRANVSISALHAPILQGLLQHSDSGSDDKIKIRSFFQSLPVSVPPELSVFPDSLRLAVHNRFADDWISLQKRLGTNHASTHPTHPIPIDTAPAPIAIQEGLDNPMVQAEVLRILGRLITGELVPPPGRPRMRHPRQLFRGLRRRLMIKPRIVS